MRLGSTNRQADRELNLIEQWGSGVPRIYSQVAAQGFPEPIIRELGLRVRFVFPLAEAIPVQKPSEAANQSGDPSRLESRLESRLAAKVVLLLEKGPAGKAELARELGHKTASGELHKQVRRLLALDLIEMTIPEKPNSRLQKYRLTDQGRKQLAQLGEEQLQDDLMALDCAPLPEAVQGAKD